MEIIKSIFTGPNGDISCKRTCAGVGIIVAIIITFVLKDNVLLWSWLSFALLLLGVTAVTRT